MQSKGNAPKGAPGIQVVHSAYCPSRSGAACTKGRKDGCRPSFRASVYEKRTKVKHKRTFATLAEAKAWRTHASSQLLKGRDVGHSQQTLYEAAEAWLEGAKAGTVLNRGNRPYKPSVIRTYERDLNNYVLPDLGAHKLTDIRRGLLKRFAARLVSEGRSPSKVRNIINPLRAIYRDAIEAELVQVNPTTGLRLEKPPEPTKRAAEPTDMLSFLGALPEEHEALYATAIFAGLRRGEMRGLRWEDVELRQVAPHHAGYFSVERSWDDVEGVIEPKSEAGKRRVPILVPYLYERLNALRERSGGTGYVFGSGTNPFEPTRILRQVTKALTTANAKRAEAEQEPLKVFGLHDGRHTFGALCRAAGVAGDDISEYLGHSRPGVTARYTSPIEVEMRDAENMRKLAEYMARADTSARLAQLEPDDLAAQLADAQRLVSELRAQLEGAA
jgi:integrase